MSIPISLFLNYSVFLTEYPQSFQVPFGAIKSGTPLFSLTSFSSFPNIVVQAIGQAGKVIRVKPNSSGEVDSSTELTTGLTGESEYTVFGLDGYQDQGFGPIIAFMSVTGSTQLRVRFQDGEGFLDPVTIAVDPTIPLRGLALEDITDDAFPVLDLALIRQISGTTGRVIVYPRISPTQFGAPVESPIVLRSVTNTNSTLDYVIVAGGGVAPSRMFVLGDDRVRVYQSTRTGEFKPINEIMLPANQVPLGIMRSNLQMGEASLLVNVKDASSDSAKSVLVYNGTTLVKTLNYL